VFHDVPELAQLISRPVDAATALTGQQYTMQCVFSGRCQAQSERSVSTVSTSILHTA